MTCESNTSKGPCANEATHRVYWPGREPLKFCEEHTRGAKNIGAAIGCHIAVAICHTRTIVHARVPKPVPRPVQVVEGTVQ